MAARARHGIYYNLYITGFSEFTLEAGEPLSITIINMKLGYQSDSIEIVTLGIKDLNSYAFQAYFEELSPITIEPSEQ